MCERVLVCVKTMMVIIIITNYIIYTSLLCVVLNIWHQLTHCLNFVDHWYTFFSESVIIPRNGLYAYSVVLAWFQI